MEEKQNGIGEDQAHEECKPEAESSRSSRGDVSLEVVMDLKAIKALGDSLNSIHAAIQSGAEPYHDTVSVIGYMLVDYAEDVADLLGYSIEN
jgi:hypothetical protein